MSQNTSQKGPRPPVVAIVGHIDHGKSTLLDYIRKTNVVESETGGITQHLSAYEAVHLSAQADKNAEPRSITFLDTPGHEAFMAMRARGLEVADVAILVVSAEEGVKPQTLEALKLIKGVKPARLNDSGRPAGLPYIVVLTKIDKPGANVEKTKSSLLENGVYLEGLGGDVPYVAVSGKTGEGVPELLDLILLAAELEGLSADPSTPGAGVVIETHVDSKRGNTATLIVQNGTVKSGRFIVSGEAFAPVRIMENFLGEPIKEAHAGSPVRIVGFSVPPIVGTHFSVVETKKQAEAAVMEQRNISRSEGKTSASGLERSSAGDATEQPEEERVHVILPVVIKTDVAGVGDAILHEIEKLPQDPRLEVRIVSRGVGAVTESDVKLVGGGEVAGLIAAFNVKTQAEAHGIAERLGVVIGEFDIIYKLTEWLAEEVVKRQPKERAEERTGAAKVIKIFGSAKGKVVLGGKVDEGVIKEGEEIKILRRDIELGRGTVVSLQSQKTPVKKVESGNEFGAQIKTDVEPAHGDILEAFEIVYK